MSLQNCSAAFLSSSNVWRPALHSNKVDVWSIGVIYYQMLFGRRPFGDGQSQDHILRNHIMLNATEVHFPSKPLITEEGKSFISDCLTYDQMSRPNIAQLCEHSYLKLATL
jgi:tousled-like kinase